MLRSFATCLFSALLGGLIAVWLTHPHEWSPKAAAAAAGEAKSPQVALAAPSNDEPPQRPGPLLAPVPPGGSIAADLYEDERVGVAVYERVNRGVVNITTQSVKVDRFFLLEMSTEGSGSGLVLDKLGHVLTNYHVVENARQVQVTLYDGETYTAEIVGADPINDIAVIKIDAPENTLFPLAFGDSSQLKVGMRVFAIGNPFGLERTMTSGIISSLNRTLQVREGRSIKSIIQTDASVNPGNSGGPLLDSKGRLIGINTAIATASGQSAGVSFAIPVNLVARVVPQLLIHGRPIRPLTGIERVYQTEQGLLIARLTPDGPAERAGLRGPKIVRERRGPFTIEKIDRLAADLIIGVDEKPITNYDDLMGYIESKQPNDKVTLKVIRDGKPIDVVLILGNDPNSKARKAEVN